MLFGKDKWKPRDITFIIEDGKPVFYACICLKWKKTQTFYDKKDQDLVDRLLGTIKRRSLTWWEVRESDKTAYYLYYHPLIQLEHMIKKAEESKSPFKPELSESLKHITRIFNWMVK